MKTKLIPILKDSQIEYTHEWFYHKKCDAYLIYMAGGTFVCDKCGYEVLFTDMGLTTEDLKQYYDQWNKPNAPNYINDKEAIEFFQDFEKNHGK